MCHNLSHLQIVDILDSRGTIAAFVDIPYPRIVPLCSSFCRTNSRWTTHSVGTGFLPVMRFD
ncbi:hypothetical protein Ahy_B10g104570 isoform E [Arachis hypogaea]|uniref:Uncharacterized protein n=1 Tax=Arachis hypogaea TaxID=3818 RepID=A0A444X5X0_ARAHY|nr:hypothetical protein Ahy_B10g104570 isoform E [Arachis hypogaea]